MLSKRTTMDQNIHQNLLAQNTKIDASMGRSSRTAEFFTSALFFNRDDASARRCRVMRGSPGGISAS
jgi:hypothetical protein